MKTKYSIFTLARRAKATLLLSFILGLAATAPRTLQAASPSELLEKGIYSEETKGDLDAALRLYQQVVAEGKTGEALAAQAQYRLGVCQYKKKNYTEARAAFEKLVADFPNQKEYVKLANEYLSGATSLLPAPWTDGEELRLDIKFQTGFKAGFVRYTANADTLNGRKIWRVGSRLAVAGVQQASRVEVDADSFKPIHSRWKHTVLGEADTTYSPGRAEVTLTGTEGVKSYELEGVCYDNEAVAQMMRRLPLAINFSTTLRVFTSLGAGNTIPIKLDVLGTEKLTVPAGTFECYRVKLGLVNQTFWYSTDEHRYLVKFDAGAVIAELASVEQGKAAPGDAAFDFTTGDSGSSIPTIQPQNDQPPLNQAKLLILAAVRLPQLPDANWCEALNAGGASPAIPADTIFAMNSQVAGRSVRKLPSDTVVFFETAARGGNRSGGAELLAKKTSGVAVAFADGRALLVDPAEAAKLRWAP